MDADRGAKWIDDRIDANPVVSDPSEYAALIDRLWDDGLPSGEKTGWPSVDALYTVVPGQMTIVTGWPSSGKSGWVDALAVNLALQGWRFAVYSPENHPVELHIAKLLQLVAGKPFGTGPTERISKDELREHLDEIRGWFGFINPKRNDGLDIAQILEAAGKHLEGHEKRGLIIDPWNELSHHRPEKLSETEYVSATLSGVRMWARETNTHVWIVAHPQKLRRMDNGELPVPTPDTISGSQHWWNKADCALTVWRDLSPEATNEVQIYCQKVRFAHVGKTGVASLDFDRVTGRYREQRRSFTDVKGLKI